MAQIDIGSVVSRALTVMVRAAPKLCLLSGLVYLPFLVCLIFGPSEEFFPGATYGQMYANLIGLFLSPLLTAVLLHEVVERLRGRTATMGSCLRVGRRRFVPMLGLTVILGLSYFVGFLLLIFPALILAVMFSVAVPVCVVERAGPFRSMDRSVSLTQGSRWAVLALVLLQGMIWLGFFVVGLVIAFAGAPYVVQRVVEGGITIIAYLVQAVFSGVLYVELRTKKEGAADRDLVDVFS